MSGDDDNVIISLIDFQPHNYETGQFLIKKFREPSHKIFSLDFEEVARLDMKSKSNCYYAEIDHKHGVLLVGQETNLIFFDLDTRRLLFKYDIGQRVYQFLINGNDLLLTCDENIIWKFNYDKMFNRKPIDECTIWKSRQFRYLWGFAIWNNVIYLSDYDENRVFTIDYNTGDEITSLNTPNVNRAANIAISPFNEIFICGHGFIELFIKDENDVWIGKKKISPASEGQGYYSIFYETQSHRIFVTNSTKMVFVLDRELNVLKSFSLKEKNELYGVKVDPKTGYLYLCESGIGSITILK